MSVEDVAGCISPDIKSDLCAGCSEVVETEEDEREGEEESGELPS